MKKYTSTKDQENERLTCKICAETFETQRSLHAHIKAHDILIGDYYVKYYPKFDLLTEEPIPFKNIEQYNRSFFRKKPNMYTWLEKIDFDSAKLFCIDALVNHIKDKTDIRFAPNYLYFLTHPRLPKLQYIRQHLSYESFAKELGLEYWFKYTQKEIGNSGCPQEAAIVQDTREQTPIEFPDRNVKIMKLDFGDYVLYGDYYNYIFVDRKSGNDFKGTMSSGYDRFCRELERAKSFNCYVYVVIESSPAEIFRTNKKQNLDFVWENMRNIIARYSDVCQFLFVDNRDNAQKIIPEILYRGQELKTFDTQYIWEKQRCG